MSNKVKIQSFVDFIDDKGHEEGHEIILCIEYNYKKPFKVYEAYAPMLASHDADVWDTFDKWANEKCWNIELKFNDGSTLLGYIPENEIVSTAFDTINETNYMIRNNWDLEGMREEIDL
jgi:hypothetical protein